MKELLAVWVGFEAVAVPATLGWSWLLHRAIGKHRPADSDEPDRIIWIPLLVGVSERAILALLVGWRVPGAAAFIGAWVIGKSVGGWQRWQDRSKYARALFFVGLLGSAASILFGIALGLCINSIREAAV